MECTSGRGRGNYKDEKHLFKIKLKNIKNKSHFFGKFESLAAPTTAPDEKRNDISERFGTFGAELHIYLIVSAPSVPNCTYF